MMLDIVWKKLEDGSKVLCYKIPLAVPAGKRKYGYYAVPCLMLDSVQYVIRDIQRETGLDGADAVVYYYARKAGWDHDEAMKIARERKNLD
jgi:uncharacterized protein YcaQ